MDPENPTLGSILPEDFEGRTGLLEKFKDDPVKAMESYRQLEQHLAQSRRVPGQDATPEEWAKFHRSMGAPESEDGYKVPDSKHEDAVAMLSGLRKTALEHGVPSETWEKIATGVSGFLDEKAEAIAAETGKRAESYQEKLKELYGSEVDQKKTQADSVLKRLVGDDQEFLDTLGKTGVLQHPGLTDLLVKVSEIVSEDQITGGLGGTAAPADQDPLKLASRGLELLQGGTMEDKRNPNRAVEYAEYVSILQKLEALGYDGGVTDPRLQPKDPFAGV